jgi:predicted DNA-binding transcriptional regulator AlpA
MSTTGRILRFQDLAPFHIKSRPTLWKLIRESGFPVPIRIGPRFLGWKEDEVIAWVESRRGVVAGRGGAEANR